MTHIVFWIGRALLLLPLEQDQLDLTHTHHNENDALLKDIITHAGKNQINKNCCFLGSTKVRPSLLFKSKQK